MKTLPLVLAIVAAPVFAKGPIVKITVKGPDLKTPIEISGANTGEFEVWAGPDVRVNGIEQTDGFIIDWRKGIVAQPPVGLRHYEVAFYNRIAAPSPVYVVSYDFDPSRQQGFVYLPGRNDDAFQYNYVMWHGHGLEGHWLHASAAWEEFVRPLIAKVRAESTGAIC